MNLNDLKNNISIYTGVNTDIADIIGRYYYSSIETTALHHISLMKCVDSFEDKIYLFKNIIKNYKNEELKYWKSQKNVKYVSNERTGFYSFISMILNNSFYYNDNDVKMMNNLYGFLRKKDICNIDYISGLTPEYPDYYNKLDILNDVKSMIVNIYRYLGKNIQPDRWKANVPVVDDAVVSVGDEYERITKHIACVKRRRENTTIISIEKQKIYIKYKRNWCVVCGINHIFTYEMYHEYIDSAVITGMGSHGGYWVE